MPARGLGQEPLPADVMIALARDPEAFAGYQEQWSKRETNAQKRERAADAAQSAASEREGAAVLAEQRASEAERKAREERESAEQAKAGLQAERDVIAALHKEADEHVKHARKVVATCIGLLRQRVDGFASDVGELLTDLERE